MTREEIAESLKLLKEQALKSHNDTAILDVKVESFVWVVESAIQALSQEPCDDAISRDAVDKYIARLLNGYLYDGERERLEIFSAYLWELPSVTQKSGKWIDREVYDADRWKCSVCGRTEQYKENYCPNCGAKMESEDKE